MMICIIDIDELSVCVCVFIHNERERLNED